MSDRRWIRRSLRKLQRTLASKGDLLSPMTVRRLLLSRRIRPRANVKHLTARPHQDRDRQFRYLQRQRRRFERRGWPVISVDSKKKELLGPFKNPGRAWNERAPEVYTYDFPHDAIAKAVPYGVYDPRAHHGAIFVGLSAYSAQPGHRFRQHPATRSGAPGHVGAKRRSPLRIIDSASDSGSTRPVVPEHPDTVGAKRRSPLDSGSVAVTGNAWILSPSRP
jgi:hypothetical protein